MNKRSWNDDFSPEPSLLLQRTWIQLLSFSSLVQKHLKVEFHETGTNLLFSVDTRHAHISEQTCMQTLLCTHEIKVILVIINVRMRNYLKCTLHTILDCPVHELNSF